MLQKSGETGCFFEHAYNVIRKEKAEKFSNLA